MRSFALLALIAAYASAVALEDAVATDGDADKKEETADSGETGETGESTEINQDEHKEIAEHIDEALNANDNSKPEIKAPESDPNNMRHAPKQDHSVREARERPNIHDHALLKSMDMSFVGGGFDSSASRSSGLAALGLVKAQPRAAGPIGFLGSGTGFVQQPMAVMSPYGAQ